MTHYMFQLDYSLEAWQAMVQNPQNRLDVVRPLIESLGGSVLNAWYTFGDYDAVVIFDLPDDVTAAAFAAIVSAGGSTNRTRLTTLVSAEDTIAAAEMAKGISNYHAPVS